jgi:molybdate transport system substrate-binding protein
MTAARRTSLLGLALALAAGQAAWAVEVRVSAAASLTDALKEIAASYEPASGDSLVFNFGGSNLLARQIQEGAPADVFLSADEATMDALERKGLLVAGSRKSLLSNTLVVVVPSDSRLEIRTIEELAAPGIRALALAEPQTVPAGIYAKEYLKDKRLWSRVIDRVVPTENVRAALAAVELGNVDAGIVYKTDARISSRVRVALEVPAAEGPRISYPCALVADSKQLEAARRFLAHLDSPAGAEVFQRHGFVVLSGELRPASP